MTTSGAGDAAPAVAPRVVTVSPERIVGWIDRFVERHGEIQTVPAEPNGLRLCATDGALATLRLPAGVVGVSLTDAPSLVAGMSEERIGLLIIRKGGFSVGVSRGTEIVAHRTGSRYLQGRTAAGGWSQQRFARRRDNQADAGFALSGKAVTEVVLPHTSTLTRVVAGGDRAAVATVLGQRGLEPIARLLTPAMIAIGPPKRAGLDELLAKARLIHIELTEPPT